MFNIVFHHRGEFVKLSDGETIYRSGVSTLVSRLHMEKNTLIELRNIVNGWGYLEYRL